MEELLKQLLEADTKLFLVLNNLGSEQWDDFWLFITAKESWFPLYGIFVILTFLQLKQRKNILLFILCTAAMVFFVDQTTSSLFKPFVGRLRPCHFPELEGLFRVVKSSCGGKYSFFSGHSSNSFAIAFYIGLLLKNTYRWVFPFLLFWAAMVAYSRIYVGVHFPVDIFVGALWGGFFGYTFYRLFLFLIGRYGLKPAQT